MSWQAVAAMQVRQNNRASAVAAKLASTQQLSQFEVERARFTNMCLKAFWFFSAAQFQRRIGTLREDDWTEFHAVIPFWLEGEGVRPWWRRTGMSRFGKRFAIFIDDEIATAAQEQK
jgi:hypothetical protein